MADIVIRGVGIPKPNEGPYIMWVYPDWKAVVYSYVVNGNEFGTDSQKVTVRRLWKDLGRRIRHWAFSRC